MGRYLLTRLLLLVAICWVISVLVFLLLHLLPGGPVAAILGTTPSLSAQHRLTVQLGLNHSLVNQYWVWFDNALHLDFGHSYLSGIATKTVIAHAVPIDLELIIYSQIIAFGLAIPLALISARRPGGVVDIIASSLTFGMLSLPAFVLGPILILLLAVKSHVFPAIGYQSISSNFVSSIHDLTMPAATLSVASIAAYFRLLRGDLIGTLQEDYIAFARSKGLSAPYVMIRHALRPSSFSLLGAAGINIGTLITGAVIVEQLFQLPGIGFQLVAYIQARDFQVVQGLALVIAITYVVVNFIVGFLYAALDPRVRHA